MKDNYRQSIAVLNSTHTLVEEAIRVLTYADQPVLSARLQQTLNAVDLEIASIQTNKLPHSMKNEIE